MSGFGERRIGPYRLLRLLMTGQNSQVWESMHDANLERYALKTLLPELRADKEQLGYMRNEFTVGSTLDHVRVVKIHELSYFEGGPFLVMEYCPFPNMKFYIQQGYERLADWVPHIIPQCAEGLAYFHARGYVHRDVKPENFLLSEDCEVKLIDFALSQRRKVGLAKLFSGKTKIQGTRSYMSPEQIRGQSLDARSDIYSFGCVCHELLCGKTPFTGSDTTDLLNKHLRTPAPSLLVVNKNVTPEFAGLVQRMLSKKLEDRPESMEHFMREFKAIRVFKDVPRKLPARKQEDE